MPLISRGVAADVTWMCTRVNAKRPQARTARALSRSARTLLALPLAQVRHGRALKSGGTCTTAMRAGRGRECGGGPGGVAIAPMGCVACAPPGYVYPPVTYYGRRAQRRMMCVRGGRACQWDAYRDAPTAWPLSFTCRNLRHLRVLARHPLARAALSLGLRLQLTSRRCSEV